jgi:predicted RNA binding protein YcfA (HicA-like mRNA interferase family)
MTGKQLIGEFAKRGWNRLMDQNGHSHFTHPSGGRITLPTYDIELSKDIIERAQRLLSPYERSN